MTVAQTLFNSAKALVEPPSGSISSSVGVATAPKGMSFPAIAHPDTTMSSSGAGAAPSWNVGSMPTPTSVSVSPQTAAYAAVTSVISWAPLPAAEAPTYGVAVMPGALPEHTISAAPTYREQALLPIESAAGLVAYDKPEVQIGERNGLLATSLTTFDVEDISPLDLDTPTLSLADIDAEEMAAPSPLIYTDDAALLARIKHTLAGSDVLSDAEQALLYGEQVREQAREDMLAVRKVMSEAARRGFSMPVGAVNADIAAIAYASRMKKQDAALKVRDETFERARTLLLDAFSKAVALETKHFALHIAYAGKLVETMRFNVRMKAELFNGTVALFNEKLQFVRTVVDAYKDYVATLEAQDAAVVAQLRGEMSKVASYRADVEMFTAQVGTLKLFARAEAAGVEAQVQRLKEYEGYLIGVKANVDIIRRNIEMFRTAVGTMGEAADAERAKFAAYAEQVAGFNSVEDVYSANVGAYAGFWKTENARTGAFSSYIDDSVRAINAEARTFTEYAQAQRSYVSALSAKVDAELDNVRTWGQAQKSRGALLSAYNRAEAELTGARNQQALANASVQMMNSALDAQASAATDQINASLLAANIVSEAGLESARLAVRSVRVNVSGDADGNLRESTGNSTSNSTSTSYSTQHITDH